MATLAGNLQHKLVSQTQPGELFRMRVRQSSGLCVNIEPAAPRFVRVGLLKSPDIDYPCTFAAEANAPCLSYGTDWIIEPIMGEESFPGRPFDHPPGTLYLGSGSAALRLDPIKGISEFDHFHIDLLNGGKTEPPDDVVPVRRWRIWAAATERNRPGGMPIAEFGA